MIAIYDNNGGVKIPSCVIPILFNQLRIVFLFSPTHLTAQISGNDTYSKG